MTAGIWAIVIAGMVVALAVILYGRPDFDDQNPEHFWSDEGDLP